MYILVRFMALKYVILDSAYNFLLIFINQDVLYKGSLSIFQGVTNTSRESTNTRLLTVMMDEASKTTKKMEETRYR